MMASRKLVHFFIALPIAIIALTLLFPGQIKARWEGWPLTVDDAAQVVIGRLTSVQKQQLRATTRDRLVDYHLSLGMAIRNDLGLLNGNEPLISSACGDIPCNADDASAVILERIWERLQGAA